MRFGESIPPDGKVHGIYSSSSSSDFVDSTGQRKVFKSSTTGVNNDGKWTFHTMNYPWKEPQIEFIVDNYEKQVTI